MKVVSVTELTALGKSAIAFILAVGGLLNIPPVAAVVTEAAKLHPHVAIITGTFVTLATLLANPQVQRVLGVNIEVPANATVQQTTTITTGSTEPNP